MGRLIKKLKDTGFEIIYSTYIFSFLVPPVFLFRTIPSMLGMAKGGVEKNRKEHCVNEKSVISRLLSRILSFEVKQIEKSRIIPFGGSCLILARKK